MFSTGRRDSTEVVYDILTLAQAGVSRGQLVQQGRLNFRLASRYLSQLTQTGLVRKRTSDNTIEKYELTARGSRVLRLLSCLEEEISGESNVDMENYGSPEFSSHNGSSTVDFAGLQDNPRRGNRVMKAAAILNLGVFLAGVGLGYLLP